jgi:hypothetical protein
MREILSILSKKHPIVNTNYLIWLQDKTQKKPTILHYPVNKNIPDKSGMLF